MVKNNDSSNDKSIQEIDTALVNAGIPKNRLNKLLKIVEEKLTCDRDCERRKKIEEYKRSWDESREEYEKLPDEISYYERKYYELDRGEVYYRDHIKKRYTDAIQEYKEMEVKKLYNVKNELDTLLTDYNTLSIYSNRIEKQYAESLNKNKALKRKIDNKEKKRATDERKVYYENEDLKTLKIYKYYLYLIYWSLLPILFIVYIIAGPFIPKKEYKNYISLIILILLYINFAIPQNFKIFF